MKLCYFGEAKFKKRHFYDKQAINFLAPNLIAQMEGHQVFKRGNLSKEDVYSLGVTLINMVCMKDFDAFDLNRDDTGERY